MSTLVQVSASGAEPVSLHTAKDWLKVGFANDDDLIGCLVTAAREYAEIFCRRSFLTTEVWSLTLDRFPNAALRNGVYFHEFDYALWENANLYREARPDRLAIEIPMGPVRSITTVTYIDANGASQTLDPSAYFLEQSDDTNPRIYPTFATMWPVTQGRAGAVTITFIAGLDQCPQGVVLAMQQMIAHWYTNREAVIMQSGVTPQNVPLAATALLWPHRLIEV